MKTIVEVDISKLSNETLEAMYPELLQSQQYCVLATIKEWQKAGIAVDKLITPNNQSQDNEND